VKSVIGFSLVEICVGGPATRLALRDFTVAVEWGDFGWGFEEVVAGVGDKGEKCWGLSFPRHSFIATDESDKSDCAFSI
jgi:hypothetical protein